MANRYQWFALLAMSHLALATADVENSGTLDWGLGAESWQQASDGSASLWSEPNFCDARALHGSAPLTVLFGISTFWDEIRQRRVSLAQAAGEPVDAAKPLEVHVLGAAYPFEGRSDWSLLASRRPADIPKVRVVLVLGTPWHMDNVPVMPAKEYDEKRSFLLQLGVHVGKPEVGRFTDAGLQCRNNGSLSGEDHSFMKADLCRDHGNGLEVVCMEKYYQDVSAELAQPDVVVMFSPGFPQIARRSWDQVLRNLLAMEVPIMVGDLVYSDSVADVFTQGSPKGEVVPPGAKWSVKKTRFEDGMTLRAMRAYGARRLGAFRNPFPILITHGKDDITAKNVVLQVFRGRKDSAKPLRLPTEKAIARRKALIQALDLSDNIEDDSNAREIQTSMLLATSSAYDKAMWQIYRGQIREWIKRRIAKAKKHGKDLDGSWMKQVEEMGLTGKPRRQPWNLNEWIFVLSKLHVADEVF
jgi:hypothetical protein